MSAIDDEASNAVIAAGAVWSALSQHKGGVDHLLYVGQPLIVEQTGLDDAPYELAANELAVRFPFLKSAYRITITRIPDSESGVG